jgi:hypothetical protein
VLLADESDILVYVLIPTTIAAIAIMNKNLFERLAIVFYKFYVKNI